MENELLRLENIKKGYADSGLEHLDILDGINLSLSKGETISIVGASGSGKSTLLAVSALLLEKDSGKIYYQGQDTDNLSSNEISSLRQNSMGFIFQGSLLLNDFSALENIAIPLLIAKKPKKEAYKIARELIETVGLENRFNHRPYELSGGEKQRIAIARALSMEPDVIFADEPTGSLDEKNSELVESLLFETVRIKNRGLLLVTHDIELAKKCDTLYTLKGGKLERS